MFDKRSYAWTAFLLCLGFLISVGGCVSQQPDVPLRAEPALELMSVSQMRAGILRNASPVTTLKADCSATFYSPKIRLEGNQLILENGQLVFAKPGKVMLRLRSSKGVAVRIVGDGENYFVDMPLFQDLRYGGSYGDPVRAREGKFHLLPDDLADALQLESIIQDRHVFVRADDRNFWMLQAVEVVQDPEMRLRLTHSLRVSRSNEQITEMRKFQGEGELRVRITYQNWRPFQVGEATTVEVPQVIILYYPADQSYIGLRLRHIRVNEAVQDGVFNVRRT